MKKTLIALALASLPVASMADVVLYGKIAGGVEVTKVSGVGGTVTNIVDYGSKIGFKGHEHLVGDINAIWQLEQKVDVAGGKYGKSAALKDANGNVDIGATVGNRSNGFGTLDSFVGLQSASLGTVKAGWQSTPVKELNGKLDIWSRDDLGAVFGVAGSSAAGLDVFTRSNNAVRRGVAVSYETPKIANAITAKAYVVPSDDNLEEGLPVGSNGDFKAKDKAIYGLSASYAQPNGGFFADLAGVYAHANSGSFDRKYGKEDGYQALAQVGYENDKFLAGVAYQYAHDVDAEFDRANEVVLTGAYNLNDALRLKASAAYGWGFKEKGEKIAGNGKYYQGIVGADYALSKRTVVNGQVGYIKFGKGEDANKYGTVSVGLSHKF